MFESHFSMLSHITADGWNMLPHMVWPSIYSQTLNDHFSELPQHSSVCTNATGDLTDGLLTQWVAEIIDEHSKRVPSLNGILTQSHTQVLWFAVYYIKLVLSWQAFLDDNC